MMANGDPPVPGVDRRGDRPCPEVLVDDQHRRPPGRHGLRDRRDVLVVDEPVDVAVQRGPDRRGLRVQVGDLDALDRPVLVAADDEHVDDVDRAGRDRLAQRGGDRAVVAAVDLDREDVDRTCRFAHAGILGGREVSPRHPRRVSRTAQDVRAS